MKKQILKLFLQFMRFVGLKTKELLYFLFTGARLEITLLWILIIFAIVGMTTEDISASEVSFNLEPPITYNWSISVDLFKLSECVGWHETKMCTDPGSPTANSRNNCWGIRPGGKLAYYASIEDGRKDFIRRWTRGYGGRYPTLRDAEVYSGMDKPLAWYKNVDSCMRRR